LKINNNFVQTDSPETTHNVNIINTIISIKSNCGLWLNHQLPLYVLPKNNRWAFNQNTTK